MTAATHPPGSALRILFSVLVLLALVAYAYAALVDWRNARLDLANELAYENKLLVQTVRTTMASHAVMLQSLGDGLLLLGTLEQPELGRSLIEQAQRLDPGMAGFGFARADGQLLLISRVPAGRPLPNLLAGAETRDSFAVALESRSLQVGRSHFQKQLGEWVIPIRQPFYDAAGTPLAMLAAGYRIEGGNAAWARLVTGPDVTVLLVRDDGYLQYQYPLPGPRSDALLQRLYGEPVPAALHDRLRQLPAATGTTELERDGVAVLAAYSRLDDYGLYAITMRPLARVHQAAWQGILSSTLWLLGYLLAAYAIYRLALKRHVQDEQKLYGVTASLQAVLDGASHAIISTDLNGTIRTFSAAAEGMLGYNAAELVAKATPAVFHDAGEVVARAAELSAEFGETVQPGFEVFVMPLRHLREGEKKVSNHEWTYVRKDGSCLPVALAVSEVRGADGETTGYIGIAQDISARKAAEDKINELAFYDQLTGLANRTLLLDRLKQATAASSRSGSYGALLLVDLDNFKNVNDTHGHDMGDLLLQQVAQRLTDCVRAEDTVARLGGDEFVVMLTNLSTSDTHAADQTETVGEKILAKLNQPYPLRNVRWHSTPSIGVILFNSEQADIDALLKQADLAMYKSKEAGRNALHFFDPAMEVAVMNRIHLEKDLREAIKAQQFQLHYQGQIAEQQLMGAEVLLRWQHPERGMVSPAEFIPLAEETGLILPLGQWALETACLQLAEWAMQPDMAHLSIAVNVSVKQFRHKDFVNLVLSILDVTGAKPQRLKLELTESLLVTNVEDIIEKMVALKAKGIGFSLDDFGTGYSSLTYLKRLPLDQLKIDQSFVRDVLTDPNDAAIARTVVALAHSLGLDVIAEGVETQDQKDMLASFGCHAYQGYFFSRPLPLEAFEAFSRQG